MVYIEAIASNKSGDSYVRINESHLINDHFLNSFISDAQVFFKNTNTNESVTLKEHDLVYKPDDDFMVAPGETWELLISLQDGRTYQSFPETILEPISMTAIGAVYDHNIGYNDIAQRFVPGHTVSVSFVDPPTDNNFYYWTYTIYEKKSICQECPAGFVFRNGECQPYDNASFWSPIEYNYGCENDCWKISFNENISLYSDEFSNGNTVNSFPIANIHLNSIEDLLIDVQQFSLTASSYNYYKVLKDILDNNGSLNAPPPAAFIGNLFNPNDSEGVVLGNFTAASTSTQRIFIDRTDIKEKVVGGPVFRRVELCNVCYCTPSCIPVTVARCEETRFSTSIKPEGWID